MFLTLQQKHRHVISQSFAYHSILLYVVIPVNSQSLHLLSTKEPGLRWMFIGLYFPRQYLMELNDPKVFDCTYN